MMKNSKKMSEKYMKALRNIFYERADLSCNMLQTWRRKYVGAYWQMNTLPNIHDNIFFAKIVIS